MSLKKLIQTYKKMHINLDTNEYFIHQDREKKIVSVNKKIKVIIGTKPHNICGAYRHPISYIRVKCHFAPPISVYYCDGCCWRSFRFYYAVIVSETEKESKTTFIHESLMHWPKSDVATFSRLNSVKSVAILSEEKKRILFQKTFKK